MTTPRPQCRIYGIMARETPTAVLFRRGPSKYVQLVRWDTDNDQFEPGQWFHGRIYERRCDLSPDGRLLVYFAANWKDRSGPNSGSWTAVSRPPYLTALALWFKGDAWSGGGLFRNNQELGLNNGGPGDHRLANDASSLPIGVSDLNLGTGEDDPVETVREVRDGWVVVREMEVTVPPRPSLPPPLPPPQVEEGSAETWEWLADLSNWIREKPSDHTGYVTHAPRIIEKVSGSWRLRRAERLQGYELLRDYDVESSGVDLTGADWAEWDHRGRLVFSRAGAVFAAALEVGRAPKIARLVDLNANAFSAIEAPEWAHQW